MRKMNLAVRFKNPVFLLTFSTTVLTFVYQILGMFGIVPAITEDQLVQIITILINLLAGLGVLVDPTTKGINDSNRALTYTKPQ